MYEEQEPKNRARGLYPEQAAALAAAQLRFDTHTHTLAQEHYSTLVEALIAALRHDNALFNEARFRALVSRGTSPK